MNRRTFSVDWQHWMVPVEHTLAGAVTVGPGAVAVTVTVTVSPVMASANLPYNQQRVCGCCGMV